MHIELPIDPSAWFRKSEEKGPEIDDYGGRAECSAVNVVLSIPPEGKLYLMGFLAIHIAACNWQQCKRMTAAAHHVHLPVQSTHIFHKNFSNVQSDLVIL